MDSDDEVRDRATFYMNVLQQKQKALNAAYIFNGKDTQTRGSLSGSLMSEQRVGLWFLVAAGQNVQTTHA